MASLKSQEKENKKKALKKFKEKGYDMQRDAFGPGSLVESETKLPKFFSLIPDAFQVEKFLQKKVKQKIKKTGLINKYIICLMEKTISELRAWANGPFR